jgi:hypothetical protein
MATDILPSQIPVNNQVEKLKPKPTNPGGRAINASDSEFKKVLQSQKIKASDTKVRELNPLSPQKNDLNLSPKIEGNRKQYSGSNRIDAQNFEQATKVLKPGIPLQQPSSDKKNGTNLAAMEVARDLENKIIAECWKQASDRSGEKFEGGLGEEFFTKELMEAFVNSMDNSSMGISEAVYKKLVNQNNE